MSSVRGWVKVLLWIGILLGCAGIGAFVASRSNPFPPEVAPESPTPTPPGEPAIRWRLTMDSRTRHVYRVGGECTSDWRLLGTIRVTERGVVRGAGVARLRPGSGCDFETAQVQARAVTVRVSGKRIGDRLRVRFSVGDVSPSGAQDLGGFVETLPAMRFSIPEEDGASLAAPTQVQDADGESHVARTTVGLSG
jgi:hypothetical protein